MPPSTRSTSTADRFAIRRAACCSGRRSDPPKEHDGGEPLPAERKQRPEVCVGGDKHALLLTGAVEDLVVTCRLHAVVPHVRRVVAGVGESLRDGRRQRLVDQEPQPATSGSSRSRTASAA